MQSAAVRRVAKELRTLMEAPLEGVRVEGNEADLSELAAVLDGPGAPRSPRPVPHSRAQWTRRLRAAASASSCASDRTSLRRRPRASS